MGVKGLQKNRCGKKGSAGGEEETMQIGNKYTSILGSIPLHSEVLVFGWLPARVDLCTH